MEITVKYEGYIRRQEKQVEEFEKLERRRLPPDMDYSHIPVSYTHLDVYKRQGWV